MNIILNTIINNVVNASTKEELMKHVFPVQLATATVDGMLVQSPDVLLILIRLHGIN